MNRGPDVQQLSWSDDMMLRAEGPATPLQIQTLLIYDPSTAPGEKVTFKGILEEMDARLHLADAFRRRLTELPGGLHMPYWVEDPNFDLEYHVRHIGLRQPWDWRQLCGLGPLIGGLNLCHVVASYNGTLSISATADRDALPDPARYAQCMDNAFQEVLAAAG
ncbi:MAG: WS/DGAT domain-containing protein [Mycobacteriaceae bacterium]|nr:WS/DGAT domain-containing protein [Mycobacteriaceae bacterium]